MSLPREGSTYYGEWTFHRAFPHLLQVELVLVDPPRIWKDAKATAGRDSAKLWRMRRVLCGRTKAPREWLECFGKVLEESAGMVRGKRALLFRSSIGQVVTELHMGDMRESGPCDALEKLEGDSSGRAIVTHAMISRARESETLEHLRGEHILPPERCFVRSDSMWSVLRHWAGDRHTRKNAFCAAFVTDLPWTVDKTSIHSRR